MVRPDPVLLDELFLRQAVGQDIDIASREGVHGPLTFEFRRLARQAPGCLPLHDCGTGVRGGLDCADRPNGVGLSTA